MVPTNRDAGAHQDVVLGQVSMIHWALDEGGEDG